MENRDGEHPSIDTVRQPLHHHHHHQILLPCQHHQQQIRPPCHHHHHHHLVMLPHCCAVHGVLLPPNGPSFLEPIVPSAPHRSTHLQPSLADQQNQSSQVFEQEDAYEVLEEEAEEDPIFVLTDEWRDLFAKSEAKRREAKKQARKQRKK